MQKHYRNAAVIIVSLLLVVVAMAQAPAVSARSQSPAADPDARQTPRQADPDDEVEQLRDDVKKMKVLLNQMRSNLAFVQTSQTPLKHQFELQADAWQVVIEQMDRRLNRMENQQAPTDH